MEETFAPWFSPGRPDWISDPMPGLEKTFRLMPHRLLGEGHYCAVLRKAGDTPGSEVPLEPAAKRPKELDDFCKQTGAALPEGKIILFGQNVYLAPEDLPSLKGLHVLRAGLELGEGLKNRFGPAHAWALWLKGLENSVSLAADAPEEADFLREIGCDVHYYDGKKHRFEIRGAERADTLVVDGTAEPADVVFILRAGFAADTLLPGLATDNGHIVADDDCAASIPGVFAAGDCTGAPYQIPAAVGEGNRAALSVVRWLRNA